MTTTALNNLIFFAEYNGTYGTPVDINNPWPDRLAGTAYIESEPMVGFVIAIFMDGPSIVGSTEINPDGTWEINNIAEKYVDKELLVIGVPRSEGVNYAIASRVKTV